MRANNKIVVIAVICMLCPAWVSAVHQTDLPTVELSFSALDRDTFSAAQIRVIDHEDTIDMRAVVRHRGSSSVKYKKQSYAIKLKDSLDQKIDTAFLGLRNDNYWILDAMAPDKARMRNKVGMELWMDYSAKPWYAANEPAMQNGANGRFVELHVNGDYRGIYNLMERVDRKQLKLKKHKDGEIRGVLYKSVSWVGSFFGDVITRYDTTAGQWMRYEYQYPDTEDSLITWEPLYETFQFALNSDSATFVESAAERYDLPVFTDYYLLVALLSARDNRGKNTFLSYYNIQSASKLVPTPWDMDHSFGRQYNGTLEPAETEYELWAPNLYGRLLDQMPDYRQLLLDRYAELRRTAFALDSLQARFSDYFALFRSTGAAEREQERWNGIDGIDLNFEEEETYILSWLGDRLAYLDELFEYKEEPQENPQDDPQDNPQDNPQDDPQDDPHDVTTGEPEISTQELRPTKRIQNGHLYIIYRNRIFDITGREVSEFPNVRSGRNR